MAPCYYLRHVFAVAVSFVVVASAATAAAQYMYLDANGDGVHTSADVVPSGGTVTFDVWLVTNQERSGPAAVCMQNGNAPALRGYSILVGVTNATVTWSDVRNLLPGRSVSAGPTSSSTELYFAATGPDLLPAGAYRLASVSLTTVLGTPNIDILQGAATLSSGATLFESDCPGIGSDYSLVLGMDWFGVDGLPFGGQQNRAPEIGAIAPIATAEGQHTERTVSATDPDGDAVTLALVQRPRYASFFLTSTRPGFASGTVIIDPGYADAGTRTAILRASDGVLSSDRSFDIVVSNTYRPFIWADPYDMTVEAGAPDGQQLGIEDPEGLARASLVSAPPFVLLTGTVVLVEPEPSTPAGSYTVTIRVTDGTTTMEKSFVVTIFGAKARPVLNPLDDMVAVEGDSASQIATATDPDNERLTLTPVGFPSFMSLQGIESGPFRASARILLAPSAGDRGFSSAAVRVTDGFFTVDAPFNVTILPRYAGSTMLLLHRDPGAADAWETLQFRAEEGTFTAASRSDGGIEVIFDPPTPSPDGTAWGPSVRLACLPAQRPSCISDRINYWKLRFQPPLGERLVPGVYSAKPVPDSTNAGFCALAWCSSYCPTGSTIDIRQVRLAPSGEVLSFWATFDHQPDPTLGSFRGEVRYGVRLPVFVDAPSRVPGHAGALLRVELRIGGEDTGPASVSSPDLPRGATLTMSGPEAAVMTWTPDVDQTGSRDIRFIAERPGARPDTAMTTICVDLPGAITATVDVNRVEAIVTNRGVTEDFPENGPGVYHPRGSGIPVARSIGLVLGGQVNGEIRVATPFSCCDFHPGPTVNGSAVPFEPRFKNYTLRRGETSSYDWTHWPDDLGAPRDASGAPMLRGDETVWSVYNDGAAPWETPYAARLPLGVEVRQTSWASQAVDHIGDVVFQRFSLRNAGSNEIRRMYAAFAVDPVTWDYYGDVGYPNRGMAGCDTTLGLGYGYSPSGGGRPNAVGVALLAGALVPGPGGLPARLGLTALQDGRGGGPAAVYNVLQGLNPDGTTRHERDDPSLPATTYLYTGDPITGTGWLHPDFSYASSKFMVSSGPFDLLPGQEQEIDIAIVAATGSDRLDAVRRLRDAARAARAVPISPSNRRPFADAGGPYSGFAGVPIAFDGAGSADPDGDALTYEWHFGDGVAGTGVQPSHSYGANATYTVRLLVSDGRAGAEDSTTADIAVVNSAVASITAGGPTVRLQSSRPLVLIAIEPVGSSFAPGDVDISTVAMARADGVGSAISAVPGKTPAASDSDHDGVAEVILSFRKADVRLMLGDLPPGKSDVPVWIRGGLLGGGQFAAPLVLPVDAGKGGVAATVAPNPLNPSATITYRTTVQGPVRVYLFDVTGRLVRVLLDKSSVEPGYHDVLVGRGAARKTLPSGVYFFRIEAAEGTAVGRLVVLK
jgi:hypothetical protein